MAYWPTRNDVKFRDTAVKEIALFVERISDIPEIVSVSEKLAPNSQPTQLIDQIAQSIGKTPAEIRSIFNTLQNVLSIKEDLGSFEKALDRISAGVPADLSKKIEENKANLVKIISNYSRDNPVSISFKAQRLTYLRDSLLHEAEIMTDVRPIFDESGANIIEFVVTHELITTSFSNEKFTRHHFSVDNADLLTLRKACDRALLKAQTLKKAFEEKKWPIEVLRDEASG